MLMCAQITTRDIFMYVFFFIIIIIKKIMIIIPIKNPALDPSGSMV